MPAKKIAIVGGGISGIACSWTLRDHDCEVDIFEADTRLGGHANSVPFKGNGRTISVDTGFIVMNQATYPQFAEFLQELDVQTIPTDMSFGVSAANTTIEWGSYSIRSFVWNFSMLFSLWFWRLIFDFLRFSLFAEDSLLGTEGDEFENEKKKEIGKKSATPKHESEYASIGDYLRKKGYSPQFITYFLIPMVAAPWCINPEEFSRTFPARTLIRFMSYHRLLDTVSTSLRWRSFRHGSRTYVEAFEKQLPSRHTLHLGTKVKKVVQHSDSASIMLDDGTCSTFDHVVLAIHANQALSLLGAGATHLQRSVLSKFRTSRNICYLHSDESLLPRRHAARVAWNCFLDQESRSRPATKREIFQHQTAEYCTTSTSSSLSITFDMNKLQDIPRPGEFGSPGRVLVTMNPSRVPQATQSSHVYYHPLITIDSIKMSRSLSEINGVQNISFAGAWMGFGFHEDGYLSGLHAANMLIHGRDNIAPLNLLERVEAKNSRARSLWVRLIMNSISAVQWIIERQNHYSLRRK